MKLMPSHVPGFVALLVLSACESSAPILAPPPVVTADPTAPADPREPAGSATPSAPVAAGLTFGIGGGEADAHTHVAFDAPKGLTSARVHVVVDRVAPVGLNFFALQVDFDNGTWAHGGLQDVDGPDGTRTRQVNWGGLVDRGGGTDDYTKQDDLADLEKIQNAPDGEHVGPYSWQLGTEYDFVIERLAAVTLPPGDYRLIPGRPLVHVDHARTLWQWRFTTRPTAGGTAFVAVLLDAAATIDGFMVWNESGYGSTAAAQHATWRDPTYATEHGEVAVTEWHRF